MLTGNKVLPPLKIFISYSHADIGMLKRLESHLSSLRRTGLIQTWHDRAIDAGSDWKGEIDGHLNEADIVMLLLSADFVASDYCYDIEMTRALERHRRGEAVVIPILLRTFDFAGLPFSDLQMLPPKAIPVASYGSQDQAYQDVVEGIRLVIDRIRIQQVSQLKRETGTDWLPQTRFLDASIAREIPRGESREVAVVFRLEQSEGLQFLLEEDTSSSNKPSEFAKPAVQTSPRPVRTYSSEPKDVRSVRFDIDLPVSSDGVLRPVPLLIRINSPDFDPVRQEKRVMLPTLSDSNPFVFFLRTNREGEHVLSVEVLSDDVAVVEQLLRARSVEHGGPGGGAPASGIVVIATLPLQVMCVARAVSA